MYVPSVVCAVLAAWQLDRRQQKVRSLDRHSYREAFLPLLFFELLQLATIALHTTVVARKVAIN